MSNVFSKQETKKGHPSNHLSNRLITAKRAIERRLLAMLEMKIKNNIVCLLAQ